METDNGSVSSNFMLNIEYSVITSDVIKSFDCISNNVVCATSKASDQPEHLRSLIRAFASRLNIL